MRSRERAGRQVIRGKIVIKIESHFEHSVKFERTDAERNKMNFPWKSEKVGKVESKSFFVFTIKNNSDRLVYS